MIRSAQCRICGQRCTAGQKDKAGRAVHLGCQAYLPAAERITDTVTDRDGNTSPWNPTPTPGVSKPIIINAAGGAA